MHKHIFVNLGVRDLKRSMDFFGKLGFTFDPKFTNDQAACMVIGENIFAMLLTTDFMRGFTDKALADAHQSTEVLTCLSCASREEVDTLVEKALAAGGSSKRPAMENGTDMYGRSFEDPDGHIWELVYMSPAFIEKGAHGG
ncbi:VOC family protein [Paraburkholderia sp. J41]|uniref:VOC family protein n=1 Tax=Paraburkholderia sp. J41 TaxID=2805433 RepID=UPI002AC366D6|nr:VOC family protein [Paraburkholderia sp. J41]